MGRIDILKSWWIQSWIAIDQFANAFIVGLFAVIGTWITGRKGEPCYADESMSAHIFRSYRIGRRSAKIVLPVVDKIFSLWQPWDNHCEQAYWKELKRLEYPVEYRLQQIVMPKSPPPNNLGR